MEENVSQETQEEEPQPKTEEKVEKAEKPKEKDRVDEAIEAAEALKKERELTKEENDRTESLRAHQALGGSADAGAGAPAKADDKEYANQLREGKLPMSDFLKTKDE